MKNRFKHNDDGTTHIFVESKSKRFPGKHTIIIDTEDWDKVKEHRWFLFGTGRTPYVATNIPHPDGGWHYYTCQGREKRFRRKTCLSLHHLVMGKPQKGYLTDHINHVGLDNRKENLRFVTRAQNGQNSRSSKNSRSAYKGVNRAEQNAFKKWRAKLKHKGKEIHIGHYACEHEAALAWNKKALELWGEYACLNEVPEGNKEKERKTV